MIFNVSPSLRSVSAFFALIFFAVLHMEAPRRSFAGVDVRAGVDKTEVEVAERIVYTLHVAVDSNTSCILPVDRPDFTPFDLLGMQAVESVEEEDRTIYRLEYVIAAYEPGRLVVPPLPVYYREDGGEEKVKRPEPVTVVVKSTVPPNEVDIHDIRLPQVDADRRGGVFVWPLVGAGLLVILFILSMYVYTRRSREGAESPQTLDPLDRVLMELDRMDPSSFDDIRDFYRAVSEMVKGFLLDGSSVPEAGLTGSAFLNMVKQRMKQEDFKRLEGFISDCYMVRFAACRPGDEEARRYLDEARSIVSSAGRSR